MPAQDNIEKVGGGGAHSPMCVCARPGECAHPSVKTRGTGASSSIINTSSWGRDGPEGQGTKINNEKLKLCCRPSRLTAIRITFRRGSIVCDGSLLGSGCHTGFTGAAQTCPCANSVYPSQMGFPPPEGGEGPLEGLPPMRQQRLPTPPPHRRLPSPPDKRNKSPVEQDISLP